MSWEMRGEGWVNYWNTETSSPSRSHVCMPHTQYPLGFFRLPQIFGSGILWWKLIGIFTSSMNGMMGWSIIQNFEVGEIVSRDTVSMPPPRSLGWCTSTQVLMVEVLELLRFLAHMINIFGQIVATSHDLSPNGVLVREIPLFHGNLGWWNIIWPEFVYIYIFTFIYDIWYMCLSCIQRGKCVYWASSYTHHHASFEFATNASRPRWPLGTTPHSKSQDQDYSIFSIGNLMESRPTPSFLTGILGSVPGPRVSGSKKQQKNPRSDWGLGWLVGCYFTQQGAHW